jgi:predicted DNA-binding WGR domain protein
MDWQSPPPNFRFVLFERINPAKNELRFYYIAWTRTLFDDGAVVRMYGRIGSSQHLISPQPFTSLEEAWPLIRTIIQTRLRHNYRVVQPEEYRNEAPA